MARVPLPCCFLACQVPGAGEYSLSLTFVMRPARSDAKFSYIRRFCSSCPPPSIEPCFMSVFVVYLLIARPVRYQLGGRLGAVSIRRSNIEPNSNTVPSLVGLGESSIDTQPPADMFCKPRYSSVAPIGHLLLPPSLPPRCGSSSFFPHLLPSFLPSIHLSKHAPSLPLPSNPRLTSHRTYPRIQSTNEVNNRLFGQVRWS
jgi:hypothetical protein